MIHAGCLPSWKATIDFHLILDNLVYARPIRLACAYDAHCKLPGPDLELSAFAVKACDVSILLTANEGANAVEGLPQRHDLSTNFLGGQLADVDRSGGYEQR